MRKQKSTQQSVLFRGAGSPTHLLTEPLLPFPKSQCSTPTGPTCPPTYIHTSHKKSYHDSEHEMSFITTVSAAETPHNVHTQKLWDRLTGVGGAAAMVTPGPSPPSASRGAWSPTCLPRSQAASPGPHPTPWAPPASLGPWGWGREGLEAVWFPQQFSLPYHLIPQPIY